MLAAASIMIRVLTHETLVETLGKKYVAAIDRPALACSSVVPGSWIIFVPSVMTE